ncbi:TRAP transporter small permease [Mangrovicella endophytica]|uniref:TRAP transporter small permease n=1 Tax=Mangrovicella endophytica TaxID=2066697 RepID=UPI0012FFE601|nr:TRAP transporter small permease [Mangrovicella endophytica]
MTGGGIVRPITQIADLVTIVLGWIVGLLLAIATAAVLCQVAVRFLLPLLGLYLSAPWTEEVARYLLIWAVFLGVAVLCRSYRLIAVEMLAFAFPPRVGTALKLFSVVVCIGFFGVVAALGFDWLEMSGIERSPVMRMPMNWVYLALPVGAILSVFNLFVFAAEVLTGQRSALQANAEMME